MNYPLISEYIEAIKLAEDNFDQLSSLRPVLDSNGNPIMSSGNFAVVFKMKDINTGKLHAVKCFIKDQEERNERYAMIAAELEQVKSPYILPIHFLEKELFVDTSQSDETEFPVLVMDWVEGKTLDAYLRENLNNQYRLQMLAYRFCQMSTWLMSQPFAHGDLKPDNILVQEDGSLVLIDYDGFYEPTMKGQEARELGSPDFRHPLRTANDFDEHIDDFSIATIALSLKAISIDAQLYHNYAASDRLLLSATDYHDIGNSEAMQKISLLASDTEIATIIGAFYIALSNKTLKKMSNNVFDIKMPVVVIGEGKTIITQEDVKQVEEKLGELINVVIADSVTSIGNDAFYGCTGLSSITIPNSVTSIGVCAFSGCSSLQSIVVAEGNKMYDSREGCNAIIETATNTLILGCAKTIIPEGVTEIGVSAFEDCASLKEIVIPESVTVIEECAFEGCTSLQSIVVAEGNKKYDSREGCNAIIETATNTLILGCAKTIIPESVTVIGTDAFFRCISLQSITIPKSVMEIGTDAFFRCTSLQSITIPKSVMEIGYYAFEGCTSLQSIVIPGSVTEIRFRTFCGCTSLQSITIPESVTKIGSGAFSGCTSLQSITIHEGVTEIGSSAFSGCTSLQNIVIPESVTEIGWSAFEGCTSLQSITIPNSVTLIGTWAFYDCTGLTSVTLSKSITEIGIGVFDRCVNLEDINILKGTRIKFEKLLDQNLHSKLVEM